MQTWHNSHIRFNYFMAYGPFKDSFIGYKTIRNYDYATDSYGSEKIIEKDVKILSINNTIGFESNFKFVNDPSLNGLTYRFKLFETADEEYADSLNWEVIMGDKFIWDDWYYDTRNVNMIATHNLIIGKESVN